MVWNYKTAIGNEDVRENGGDDMVITTQFAQWCLGNEYFSSHAKVRTNHKKFGSADDLNVA